MTPDLLFDPLSPDTISNPFPSYSRLRNTYPIYWHRRLKCWVITSHAECVSVLTNWNIFTTDFRRVGLDTPEPLLSLQTIDGPEHALLRQFGNNALHAQDLKSLEQDTFHRANTLLDTLENCESFDFVQNFADPLTLGTICKLLGVDPPIQDTIWSRLNKNLDDSMDCELAPESLQAGLAARETFNSLVIGWMNHTTEQGLVRYIVDHIKDAGVPREILVNSIRAFWHAGFEVPSRFLANAMASLLNYPDALNHIDSKLFEGIAIEELIRFAGPVHALSRACTQDTTLRDVTIKHGDIVTALIAAGNRDPEVFDRPEEIILDRSHNPHLGFGKGPHACMGAHIARMEARIALRSIFQRFPHMKLLAEPTARSNATLRGPSAITMTFRC